MRCSRRPGFAVACAVLLLAAACKKEEKEEPVTVPVTVAAVARGDVADTLDLQGKLVPPADEDASLAPQVAGRLVSVPVRAGDAVAKGALLASVEVAPLAEAERAASAALEKARAEEAVKEHAAALTASLFERGIASREEKENDAAAAQAARAARVDAEAHETQALRQRGWAELRAPFAGVVGQLLRHEGEAVDGTPATPVVRLLGLSAEEVEAEAASGDLARVKVGFDASVRAPGDDVPLRGRVTRVAGAVDTASGLGEVRVRLTGRAKAPLLSPASVSIVLARRAGVLVVPPKAIRRAESGAEEVVVVENGAAAARPVKLGLRAPAGVEIVEGLKEGETIVVDSPLGLADGTKLEIRKPK